MAKRVGLVCLAVILASSGVVSASAQSGPRVYDHTVVNPHDGTKIVITVFKPTGATAAAPVPVVLHSHGWGGSRTTTVDETVEAFLDAGLAVVSIDQRGHGESGGKAHSQDPTRETEDIKAVIDYVAGLDWVSHDRDESGRTIADDPVLGAIGGSYGGGYQTMTALDELADEGRTRFNALAPEISWYDLPESLAPQKVVRTAWATLLYAAGAEMVPRYIHRSFVWGAASGQWPDGTLYGRPVPGVPDLDSEFHTHSPVWFVERGFQIDIPMLLRQGASDNLFNLNQGLHLFNRALTDEARNQSYLVSYNGGHALPSAAPPGGGVALSQDACTSDFTALTIDFFQRAFSGRSTDGLLPRRYNLTAWGGDECLVLRSLKNRKPFAVQLPGAERVIATAGLGAPLHVPLQEGPMTVAGIPILSGTVTSAGLDARAFFGLSVGSTPADALVVQNNLMPLRQVRPVEGKEFSIELPGVAVEVPADKTLYLTISPISDIYFGHGSRVPGALELEDLTVDLPTH